MRIGYVRCWELMSACYVLSALKIALRTCLAWQRRNRRVSFYEPAQRTSEVIQPGTSSSIWNFGRDDLNCGLDFSEFNVGQKAIDVALPEFLLGHPTMEYRNWKRLGNYSLLIEISRRCSIWHDVKMPAGAREPVKWNFDHTNFILRGPRLIILDEL